MKRALIFATAYLPLVGGAEVALKEITDRLPEWEFDLFCAKIKPGLPARERLGNVTVHRCGFGRTVDKYLLPITAIWRALRVGGFDYNGVVWSFLASYNGFAALVYTWFRPRVRLLLTLQEGDPLEYYDRRTGIFRGLHRQIFKRANAVQAISHFLAEWAKNMGHAKAVTVIPNGVEVMRFSKRITEREREAFRASLGYTNGDVVIVTVSRLVKKNAVDDLVRALSFLPSKYKVIVAGEGEDREMIEKLADELQVRDRVQLLGNRGQEELPKILQSADIFCRPSLSEGLGISFLEAMAAGVPVIASPVGGIPDFLKNGETGLFCESRNPESIARAAKLLAEDPNLRLHITKEARRMMEDIYTWDHIAPKISALLEHLDAGV